MPSNVKEKLGDGVMKGIEIILTPVSDVLSYFARKHFYLPQEIAGDVLISSEWTIIKPQSPMKINKRFQRISLHLEGCRRRAFKHMGELILPDGTILSSQEKK